MMRIIAASFLKLFSVVLSLLAIVSCSTSPTGRDQFIMVSDGEMNRMGSASFQELKAKIPIEKDANINRYVKCVANAVAQEVSSGTTASNWEVVVFKDASANAFALPGGKIGVHTGLLKVAKTPGQLAAVLGHEVGHVIARHGAERVSQTMATQSGLILADILLDQRHARRSYIMAGLGLGAQFGVLLPFSRKHETEADEIGVMLMAQAGFHPEESVKLWQNMMSASGGKQPPEFMSTHPSGLTRINDLRSHMREAMSHYQTAQAQGKSPNCQI
jgi:predicted Zn-dependent protease